MAFEVSVALPAELARTGVETVAARSRVEQWRRNPGYRFRIRGDDLVIHTAVGGNRVRNPARLRARLVEAPEGLRLEGRFQITPLIESVFGVAVLALVLGFLASAADAVVTGMLVCGIGALALGGLEVVMIRQRKADAAHGSACAVAALVQAVTDPEGPPAPAP